jgi:hypothetical protein
LIEHTSTPLFQNNFVLRDFSLCIPNGRVLMRFYPRDLLTSARKTIKIICQYNRYPCQDSKQTPHKYMSPLY